MFVLFAACCSTWSYFLHLNKSTTHKIHYLMLALVGAKALTVLSQALMCHYIEFTGHADGWNIAYYFFTFVRGMLFFTVVVLVGTGWSYMKPFLGDREKRILLVVVPLQVGRIWVVKSWIVASQPEHVGCYQLCTRNGAWNHHVVVHGDAWNCLEDLATGADLDRGAGHGAPLRTVTDV